MGSGTGGERREGGTERGGGRSGRFPFLGSLPLPRPVRPRPHSPLFQVPYDSLKRSARRRKASIDRLSAALETAAGAARPGEPREAAAAALRKALAEAERARDDLGAIAREERADIARLDARIKHLQGKGDGGDPGAEGKGGPAAGDGAGKGGGGEAEGGPLGTAGTSAGEGQAGEKPPGTETEQPGGSVAAAAKTPAPAAAAAAAAKIPAPAAAAAAAAKTPAPAAAAAAAAASSSSAPASASASPALSLPPPSLAPDPIEAFRPTADRLLSDWLCRRGCVEAVSLLAPPGSRAALLADGDAFASVSGALEGLSRRDAAPALAWCEAHAGKLKKTRSLLPLHLWSLRCLAEAAGGDARGALALARAHLAPHAALHPGEVSRVAAALALGPGCAVPRYRELYAPARWRDVADELRAELCRIHGLPAAPPLVTHLQAGICALKAPSLMPPDAEYQIAHPRGEGADERARRRSAEAGAESSPPKGRGAPGAGRAPRGGRLPGHAEGEETEGKRSEAARPSPPKRSAKRDAEKGSPSKGPAGPAASAVPRAPRRARPRLPPRVTVYCLPSAEACAYAERFGAREEDRPAEREGDGGRPSTSAAAAAGPAAAAAGARPSPAAPSRPLAALPGAVPTADDGDAAEDDETSSGSLSRRVARLFMASLVSRATGGGPEGGGAAAPAGADSRSRPASAASPGSSAARQPYPAPSISPTATPPSSLSSLVAAPPGARSAYPRDSPFGCPAVRVLARSLPTSKRSTSSLVCAVSRKPIDDRDPPLVLPNGYVYSTSGLGAHTARGWVVCPHTGERFARKDARKIFVV